MPGLTTKQYGTGDYSWMLNTDGLDEAVSGVLDVSTFTKATHFPDGYFPCGLPVRIDDRDVIRPWADTAGARLGFLKGDVKTDGVEDVNCAVVVRGNIKTAKVAAILAGFVVPTTAAQPQFAYWSLIMPLWTDLIDPVEATGIARDEQDLVEQQKGGTLARFLPNVYVDADHVKFYPGSTGLVDAARYRAFNAPAEIGKGQGVKASTIDLPSIARSEPIDEVTQKELQRLSDDRVRKSIEDAIRRNVRAISMRQELSRGLAIHAGALVVDQDNFWINDVFGRDASLTVAAGTGNWWIDPAVDRLTQLNTWCELYASLNNDEQPGRIVFGSRAAYNAYAAGNQFKTLVGTSSRPPVAGEVASYLSAAGLPDSEIYGRSVSLEGVMTKVLNPKFIYLLPEPVDPADENGSVLGATYWGRTVSAGYASWGIEPDEQPGIVCGIFKDERVGSSIEAQGDSIGEPVLANPNASMAIQVLQ